MKKRTFTSLLIAAVVGIGVTVQAEHPHKSSGEHPQAKEGKSQSTCPVMGGKINKAQYADVNGKRIYVCCAGCIAKIKANPDKYIKKLEAEGIVLDKTPAKNKHEAHDQSERDHSGHNH